MALVKKDSTETLLSQITKKSLPFSKTKTFKHSSVANIRLYWIRSWYGNYTTADKTAFKEKNKKAAKKKKEIIGLLNSRACSKITHHIHHLFSVSSPGSHYRTLKTFKSLLFFYFFYSTAITELNFLFRVAFQ